MTTPSGTPAANRARDRPATRGTRTIGAAAAALLLAAAEPKAAHGVASLSLPRPATPDSTGPTKKPARGAAKSTRRRATPPPFERATPGEKVPVVITYYCLKGLTRTENEVRPGIVAADPRVFPLRRHVDLSVRGRPLGRFLVDDTGGKIKGNILDIWVPSCAEARRRGRHRATAILLTRAESRAERAKQRKLEQERKRQERQRLASGAP